MSINRPEPGETAEQFKARRALYMRDWYGKKRKPKKARAPRLGEYVPASRPARMVLSPWVVERDGVMARELRGV